MKMIKIISYLFIILFLSIFIFQNIDAENITEGYENLIQNITNTNLSDEAVCSEQLQICINEYNDLLSNFRNGTNCGGISSMLKSLNRQLGDERDSCRDELNNIGNYKIGFYLLLIILVITAILIIISIKSKK